MRLRREVGRRAHDDVPGHAGHRRLAFQPREPEVQELELAAAGEGDVARLDVAVDDAGLVQAGHDLGDFQHHLDRDVERQRDALGERAPVDELHDDHRRAAVDLEAEDRREVPVRDRGEGLRFAPQAGDVVRRADGRQRLDRHAAAEREIERLVDDAGSALADPPLELEATGDRFRDEARRQRGAAPAAEVVLGRVDPPPHPHSLPTGTWSKLSGEVRRDAVLGALFGDLRVDGLGHANQSLGDLLAVDAVTETLVHGPPQVAIRRDGASLLCFRVVAGTPSLALILNSEQKSPYAKSLVGELSTPQLS